MCRTIGIVREHRTMTVEVQVDLIKNFCGDIPFEDISWKNTHQTIKTLRLLKRAGFNTLVLQSLIHLANYPVHLQEILSPVHEAGFRVLVVEHGRFDVVDISASAETGMVAVRINGVDWLDAALAEEAAGYAFMGTLQFMPAPG